jgi:anti-anti-sigma regulatory factor
VTVTDALRVLLHGDDERAVVELQGDLGAESLAFFREVVEQLIAQPGGARRIELHLDELERCDAGGAELLSELERAAATVGREIVVISPAG